MGGAGKKLIAAAEALLSRQPDADTPLGQLLGAIGETVQDIWQENAATLEVFMDMMTQWNVGPGGLVGLRYEALPGLLDMRGIASDARRDLFDGLRVMERAAMGVLRG